MNLKLAGRKVEMFRTHIDPMIGPTPRNAFVPASLGMEAYVNEECSGIIVRLIESGQEYYVPYSNIQSSRLAPMPAQSEEAIPIKRGPGRPPVHPQN